MTDRLTDSRLDEIQARVDAATVKPWEEHQLPFSASSGGVQFCLGCFCIEWENEEADRPFIAHSRTDIPDLLTALAESYERAEELRASLIEKEFALEERDKWIEIARNKQDTLTRTIEVRNEAQAANTRLREGLERLGCEIIQAQTSSSQLRTTEHLSAARGLLDALLAPKET